MAFDDIATPAADVVAITGAPGISVRRITLDEILVNAAADAGDEVRTRHSVTGLVMDGGRVAGITTRCGRTAGASRRRRRRRALRRRKDGRRAGVQRNSERPRLHVGLLRSRSDRWRDVDRQDRRPRLPRHADRLRPDPVAACPSIERRNEVRADREAVYEAGLRAWPQLHAGVDGAHRGGPVRTMSNMRGFFRPSAGPGWALVGDAGHFKDPTPGQGISDAFRQSEKLAAAINRALYTDDGTLGRDPARVVALARRGRVEDVLVRARHGLGRTDFTAAPRGRATDRR